MVEFGLAFSVFLAAHAAPRAFGLRARLIERVGRGGWVALYSAVSVALLVWLIDAARRAPVIPLWSGSATTAWIALAAMLPACVLLATGATRANPASASFRGGPADARGPGILALTRHPILWAFLLWSASHALANGDLAGVALFGGFALFSALGMRAAERRCAAGPLSDALAISRGTLSERFARAASPRLALEAAAGLTLYAALLRAHGPVFGVSPLHWI